MKYVGMSEAGDQTIRAAHAVHPGSVLQAEYSVFERDVEQLFPTLRELDIGFVAYSPLGRRFLTGTAKPALAWLLDQGEDIVPIPKTRSAGRVEENTAAAEVILTDVDLARINEILPAGGFGARYHEAMLPVWH